MNCELLVPALFPARARLREAFDALRLPALELLFARGRHTGHEGMLVERWLLEHFGAPEAPLAAGVLTALADGATIDALSGTDDWSRADPVHLRVDRDRLTLVPGAAFDLSAEEAHALCETLNRHFAPEISFQAFHPKRWCARLGAVQGPDVEPTLEIAGEDMNTRLPAGDSAHRWHALLNEIQMVLHTAAVNEARERRGEPPVNSVWLWGSGALPSELRARWQSVSADDPVARGLAQLAGVAQRGLAADAEAWLAAAPEGGRHLIVLEQLREPYALGDAPGYAGQLQLLEARWFAPLLSALRRGRIGMVTLGVPDGAQACSVETIRGDLRRFWRRARALASYA